MAQDQLETSGSRTAAMVAAAPLLFVLLWSSSFVTAKVGLRHLSPLLFVAIRLVACALVLAALMLVLRQSWRSLAEKCDVVDGLVEQAKEMRIIPPKSEMN